MAAFSRSAGASLPPDSVFAKTRKPLTSFDAVALVGATSNVLVVNPAVPAHSVAELVAYAKANPGKVNFSSGGIGVLPHLIGEMFKDRAGIDIVHVPYKGGGPSINDVMAGNVQMTFEGTSVLLPLIQAGKLRPLAVTSANRIPEMPDVPTAYELAAPEDRALIELAELPLRMARPFVAPPELPPERAAILKHAFMETQSDPAYLAEANDLQIDISPLSGDAIQQLLRRLAGSPPALIQRYKDILEAK